MPILGELDETYIKVKRELTYLYRAVDRNGQTLDCMLSKRLNTTAATNFFARALSTNGIPLRIVIDKSGANGAGIKEVNKIFKRFGCPVKISTVRSNYLNNIIEGRRGSSQITIADLTDIAAQDIAMANAVLEALAETQVD